MRGKTGVLVWVAIGVLLAVLAFAAAFFLPFWDYSKTYAPVLSTQALPTAATKAVVLLETSRVTWPAVL